MDDEALMAAYYACDNAALETVYQRYLARLHFFFRGGGLSANDVEEQAQEVFLRVMNTKHHMWGSQAAPYDRSGGASLRTWLFRIASNLLCTALERRGRWTPFSVLDPAGEGEDAGPIEQALAEERFSPEMRALVRERVQAVRNCLHTLPDRERVVVDLWLATEGEMKLADIGESLGVSVPTAHRVLRRALDLMRRCLAAGPFSEEAEQERPQ
jgi:RNA polymerase sigma factor (sigma-70 family)